MVEIEDLARRFTEHVGTLKSARVACSFLTGIEGWFRIELVPILLEIGAESVGPRHSFPGGGSADLYANVQGHLCVFEVLSLVDYADAEKVRRFPVHLDRLQRAVAEGSICQGIAFVALNYPLTGPERVARLVRQFFGQRGWTEVGPRPLYRDCPLHLHLASVTAASCPHGGVPAQPTPPTIEPS